MRDTQPEQATFKTHWPRDKSGQVAPPSGQAGPCSPPLCGQPTWEGERRTLRSCHTSRESSHITAFLGAQASVSTGTSSPSEWGPLCPAAAALETRREGHQSSGDYACHRREKQVGQGLHGARGQETLPARWEQHLRRGQHLGRSCSFGLLKALLATLLHTHWAAGRAGQAEPRILA